MECIRCGEPVEPELVFPFAQCRACAEAYAEAQEEEQRTKELIRDYWLVHPFWQSNVIRWNMKRKVVWRKRH